MNNIKRIPLYSAWEQECFNEIADLILSDLEKKNIALSGGSTPIPIYQRIGALLRSLPDSKKKNIRFFLVDERNVSMESPRSNSAMILKTIGSDFVIPYDPFAESPKNYTNKILQHLKSNGVLDLVVLGCGDDGHTASLFPNTSLLNEKSSAFLKNELPSGELRYSMTLSLINNATRRVVFVNNHPEKLKYFTPMSVKERTHPIHQVLSISNTKVFLHEAV
ncbi:MAG: hypothetical protein CMC19_05345 [Flavobacteriaceae bacterium]|nr:hypothetical protein [Flavobacteriaceae bacterium]